MSVTSALGNQAKLLWQFLGFFQKPYLRFLHAIIAVLVILQILSSFAMHMLSSGQLNPALSSWLASWYHILSGLLVVILSLLLAADSLTKRGFHYFFPYLWGDTEQLITNRGKLSNGETVIRKLSFATPGMCRLIFDYCGAIFALPGAFSLVTAVRFLNGRKSLFIDCGDSKHACPAPLITRR